MADTGNDPISFIFGGNTGLTYDTLVRRRRVAEKLAAQQKGFPKNIGEGLTYLGNSIGEAGYNWRLDAAERAYADQYAKDAARANPAASTATPTTAAPTAAPPNTVGSNAPITPKPVPTERIAPPSVAGGGDGDTFEGTPYQTAQAAVDNDTPQAAAGFGAIDDTMTPPPKAGDIPMDLAYGNTNVGQPPAEGFAGRAQMTPGSPPLGYLGPNPYRIDPSPPSAPAPGADAGTSGAPVMAYAPPGDLTTARRSAVGGMETGGVRDPYTKVVDTGKGDQVFGRYGIAGKNIPQWTEQALGQRMTPQQFLANPQAQDATFDHHFNNYANKYGEGGAARAWYAGERGMNNPGATDRFGRLTVAGYEQDYLSRLQGHMRGGDGGPGGGAGTSGSNSPTPASFTGGTGADAPGGGRDAVVRALMQQDSPITAGAGAEVPQANPTQPGEMSPPTTSAPSISGADGSDQPARRIQVASLDPSIGMSAVAPREAASNPPIPTDIAAAPAPPVRVAQAGGFTAGMPSSGVLGGGAAARPAPQAPEPAVPGPFDAPKPQPPAPAYGGPPPYGRNAPPPPPPTPITPEELRAQQLILAHPGDQNYKVLADQIAAPGITRRTMTDAQNQKRYEAEIGAYTEWQKTFLPAEQLKQKEAEQEAAYKQSIRERFGTAGHEPYLTAIKQSKENADTIQTSIEATRRMRSIVDGAPGMFTGSDAEVGLALKKAMAAAGFPVDPKIAGTEEFRALAGNLYGPLRKAVIGTGPQSNAELETLKGVAAGDIKLDEASIKAVLNNMERLNMRGAIEHQRKLEVYVGNDANDRRMMIPTYGLPMENIVPQHVVDGLKANPTPERMAQVNRTFHTPGLAERLLTVRR